MDSEAAPGDVTIFDCSNPSFALYATNFAGSSHAVIMESDGRTLVERALDPELDRSEHLCSWERQR